MLVRRKKYKQLEEELEETYFLLEITTGILNMMDEREARERHPVSSKKKTTTKKAVKK
jgi:hypothetical protein